jgi:enoyl-[acyl-carrier protein] reductase I
MSVTGKTVAVLGVADRESIAWHVACQLDEAGARVVVGYQQRFYSRVRLLLQERPSIQGQRADVLDGDELDAFFAHPAFAGGQLDGLVHSVAYGPPSVFSKPPSEVNVRDFTETLDISAHSLSRVVRHARPVLKAGGSVVTLSFLAAQRAMPLYGMMGVAKSALESLVRYLAVELGRDRIRCNVVSPGPIETLAALSELVALKRDPTALERLPSVRLREMLARHGMDLSTLKPSAEPSEEDLAFARRVWREVQQEFADRSPIHDTVTAQDVADTVAFLLSDGSRKMTGQVLMVDCGFSSCLMV